MKRRGLVSGRRTSGGLACLAAGLCTLAGAGGLLLWSATGSWRDLRTGGPADPEALVVLVASLGGALACLWVTATAGATAADLLGAGAPANLAGRTDRALAYAGGATPRAVRQLVGVALGLAVVAASTAPAAAAPRAAIVAASAEPVAVDAVGADRVEADRADTDRVGANLNPAWTPSPLVTAPRATPAPCEEIVVRRGDTLWALAAQCLPATAGSAEIAAEWPRWYAANRDVVGPDPDLLLPGQRLRVPSPDPAQPTQETRR